MSLEWIISTAMHWWISFNFAVEWKWRVLIDLFLDNSFQKQIIYVSNQFINSAIVLEKLDFYLSESDFYCHHTYHFSSLFSDVASPDYLLYNESWHFWFSLQVNASPTKPSGGGGMGSPKGVSKTTVVAVSIIAVVSVVYAGCSQQPNVHIIIFIPPSMKLRKWFFNFLINQFSETDFKSQPNI